MALSSLIWASIRSSPRLAPWGWCPVWFIWSLAGRRSETNACRRPFWHSVRRDFWESIISSGCPPFSSLFCPGSWRRPHMAGASTPPVAIAKRPICQAYRSAASSLRPMCGAEGSLDWRGGGGRLQGGEGTLYKSIIGVFIMVVLGNSLNLLNVDSYWQRVAIGAVIIAAAAADRLRSRH